MVLTLVQAAIFVAYVTFLMIKFKGPIRSISQSWYSLEYPLRNLFPLFCFSLGLTMTFQPGSILFFLSGVALTFVGVASYSQSSEKITKYIHFAGAISCIVLALLGIWFGLGDPLPFTIWALASIFMILFKIKNYFWWIELVAFGAIIIGLLNL